MYFGELENAGVFFGVIKLSRGISRNYENLEWVFLELHKPIEVHWELWKYRGILGTMKMQG